MVQTRERRAWWLSPPPRRLGWKKGTPLPPLSPAWRVETTCPGPRLARHCQWLLAREAPGASNVGFPPDSGTCATSTKSVTIVTSVPVASEGDAPAARSLESTSPVGFHAADPPLQLLLVPPGTSLPVGAVEAPPSSSRQDVPQPDAPAWIYPWDVADYRATDEYHLHVDARVPSIRVTSRTERGLYYGLVTLAQLASACPGGLLPCEVHDAPAVGLRALHFDLKAGCPTADYLARETVTWARFKVNAVVVEWEDKFPFTGRLAALRHPAALTPAGKDRWLDACHAHYVEVIPLVQSLGHLEYVLRHPEFEALGELHGIPGDSVFERKHRHSMVCPLRPGTRALVRELHAQVVAGTARHGPLRHVHVGMDETRVLGYCPACRAAVEAEADPGRGKARLFVDHLAFICDYHLAHDRVPIVWADMLVHHPALIDEIDRRVVICDWEYSHPASDVAPPATPLTGMDPTGETVEAVRTWARRTWAEIERDPPPNFPVFQDAWRTLGGQHPLRAFPYTYFFRERGFRVLCAPAVQCGHATPLAPRYARRLANILHFTATAARRDALGVLCTNWQVRRAPWPVLAYGLFWAADTAWTGTVPSGVLPGIDDDDAPSPARARFWRAFFFPPGARDRETAGESAAAAWPDLATRLASPYLALGHVGGTYDAIYHAFARQPFGAGRYDPGLVRETARAAVPRLLSSLETVDPGQTAHPVHYEYLLVATAHAALLGEVMAALETAERVALDYEDEVPGAIPPLAELRRLLARLEALPARVEEVEKCTREVLARVLHPVELKAAVTFRFAPLHVHLAAVASSFPALVHALERFTSSVVDHALRRLR